MVILVQETLIYESHPTILKIKEKLKLKNKFVFKDMTSDEIENEINRLNSKKACIKNDILSEMLINCIDIVCSYLTNIYNNSKKDHKYPTSLKVADVKPLPTKNEKILLKNYRPGVSFQLSQSSSKETYLTTFFYISIHFCPLFWI